MTLLRLIFGGLICWRRGHDPDPVGPFSPLRRRCRRCGGWVP